MTNVDFDPDRFARLDYRGGQEARPAQGQRSKRPEERSIFQRAPPRLFPRPAVEELIKQAEPFGLEILSRCQPRHPLVEAHRPLRH
ncbi:MAG: hypothetical protein MZV70_20515 [Desulfobacterales bacterium]|nr:hypothetical protein [Desulfobacterales bacterium]